MWHPVYYYFRRIQPWTRSERHNPDVAARYLNDPAEWRPMLLGESVYQAVMQRRTHAPGHAAESMPSVAFLDSAFIGPGPFAVCATEAALERGR
jgi:hypothetical protein